MRKILFCIVIIFYSSLLYAQKGIFKEGTVVHEKESDTLNVSIVSDLLIIDVTINNKVYKFILDSGTPTTISTNIIGNFDVRSTDDIYDAYNNVMQVDYKTIPELKIGNTIFKNINAMEFDIPIFEDFEVDGFIGANIIAKCVWDFDLAKKRIILHKKISKNTFPISNKIKLEDTGTPLLPLEYYRKVKETVWIDFGFNGLFSLSNSGYNVLKEKGFINKEVIGNGMFAKTAFGAEMDTYYQTILSINAKNFTFNNFIADVDYDEESSIGSEILKYYRIALDIKKKRMYLKPYNKKPITSFRTFGINVGKSDTTVFVNFLWEKSQAFEF